MTAQTGDQPGRSAGTLTARARRPSTAAATSSVPVPVPGAEETPAPPPRTLSTAADLIVAIEGQEQQPQPPAVPEVLGQAPIPALPADHPAGTRPEPGATTPSPSPSPPAPALPAARPDAGTHPPQRPPPGAPATRPTSSSAAGMPSHRGPSAPQQPDVGPTTMPVPRTPRPAPEPIPAKSLTSRAHRPAAEPGKPADRIQELTGTLEQAIATLPALLERARRAPSEPALPSPKPDAQQPAESPIPAQVTAERAEHTEPQPARAAPPDRPAVPPVTIGEIHIHEAVPAAPPADPLALLAPYGGGLTARRSSSAGAR